MKVKQIQPQIALPLFTLEQVLALIARKTLNRASERVIVLRLDDLAVLMRYPEVVKEYVYVPLALVAQPYVEKTTLGNIDIVAFQ